MTDQGLTSAEAYYHSGWRYTTNSGYYVHRGRVYLAGAVDCSAVNGGSATILAGLPPELCPASPAAGRLLIDPSNSTSEYAPDSATGIGPWVNATMSPDGTLSLDAGNPFSGDDDSLLSLIYSNISWRVATADDTYAPQDLSPHVTTAANLAATGFVISDDPYQQVDGTYRAHDARLHLAGHIVAGAGIEVVGDRPLIRWDDPTQRPPNIGTDNGDHWTEVPTKQGYRWLIESGPVVFFNGLLARVPGNGGSGSLDSLFYERSDSGTLYRGSNPSISVTPGTDDAGLSFTGLSGNPVTALQPSATWTGTVLTANLTFAVSDLGTDVSGSGQLCYLLGLAGASVYYKVVLTYASLPDEVVATLWRVTSGGSQVQIGGWALDSPRAGQFAGEFVVVMTTDPLLSLSGPPGTIFFELIGAAGPAVFVKDMLGGGSATGDCAVHHPASGTFTERRTVVAATGSFPQIVAGDVIDLTGCGWPLAISTTTRAEPGVIRATPGGGGIRRCPAWYGGGSDRILGGASTTRRHIDGKPGLP